MKFIRDTFGFSLARLIEGLAAFALISVYTRHIPTDEYAYISIFVIYVSLAEMLVDARLSTAFQITFCEDTREERAGKLWLMQIFNALIFLLITAPALFFPNTLLNILKVPNTIPADTIWWVQAMILTRVPYRFFTNTLIVEKKPWTFFSVTMLVSAVYFAVTFSYFQLGNGTDFTWYFKGHVAGAGCGAVAGLLYFLKNYPLKSARYDWKKFYGNLRLGMPLIPAAMVYYLQSAADKYMLNMFGYPDDTGIYSAAAKFPLLISGLFILPVLDVIAPHVYKSRTLSPEKHKNLMADLTGGMALLLTLVVPLYTLVLSEAYGYVAANEYSQGYPLCSVLMLGVALAALGRIFGLALQAEKRTVTVLQVSLAVTILNIVLNAIAIPKWQIWGAVGASVLATVSETIIYFVLSQRSLGIRHHYTVLTVSVTYVAAMCLFFAVNFINTQQGSGFGLGARAAICIVPLLIIIPVLHFMGRLCIIDRIRKATEEDTEA